MLLLKTLRLFDVDNLSQVKSDLLIRPYADPMPDRRESWNIDVDTKI